MWGDVEKDNFSCLTKLELWNWGTWGIKIDIEESKMSYRSKN